MTPSKPSYEKNLHDFLARKERNQIDRATGPFKSNADSLRSILSTHERMLSTTPTSEGLKPGTDVINFSYHYNDTRSDFSYGTRMEGQVGAYIDVTEGLEGEETRLVVALDPDVSNSEMHRFVVELDGHVTDLDDTEADLSQDALFKRAFTDGIQAIDKHYKDIIYQKQHRRLTIRNRFFKTTGALIGVAGLATGGTYLVQEKIIEPREEEKAARVQFDSEGHVLPGDTLAIESIEPGELPKGAFDDIPEFKDGDDISSPRTIDVTMNTCNDIDVSPAPGQELAVAIREGSIFINSKVTAKINDEGKIDICVTDSGSESTEEEQVAVQLRD